MANIVKTTTPHAAVLVWNYRDRLGTEDTLEDEINAVDEVIVSTASLISISTAKAKGEPVGKFQLLLAPNKNWVSTITAGSWCCIMMSQSPITKADIDKANAEKVKFIGKIESVRLTTVADPETGAKQTAYRVVGVDWGHIFENNVYIDPFIDKGNNSVGAATYIELFNKVIGVDNRSGINTSTENITNILSIIGQPLSKGFTDAGTTINRVAKVDFAFAMPTKMREFFGFWKDGALTTKDNVVDAIQMYTGKLQDYDQYQDIGESSGFIDPASFRGVNTLWQLLIDNSNTVLNEMYCDIRWLDNGRPTLGLYNRIKPFSFRGTSLTDERLKAALEKETFGTEKPKAQVVEEITGEVKKILSSFQNVRTHLIPLEEVIDIEAGTNWRDKFNFIEIKPSWQIYDVLSSWVKTVAQTADVKAFQREGFRPLIVSTKQFPTAGAQRKDAQNSNSMAINIDLLAGWKHILREWFFDTHRLLNGTINIIGQNAYIQVGDNIKIKQDVLGQTYNTNSATINQKDSYLLAHVENITNTFRVDQNGARSWVTTISFVRGIMVSNNGKLIGEGKMDSKSTDIKAQQDNTVNTVEVSSGMDISPKRRGK